MSQSSNDSTLQNNGAIWAASLALVIIWGSAFTLIGYVVDYITPLWVVIYRLSIGAAFMFIWTYLRREKLPKLSDSRWIWYGPVSYTHLTLPTKA